jgi:hypothetical protein
VGKLAKDCLISYGTVPAPPPNLQAIVDGNCVKEDPNNSDFNVAVVAFHAFAVKDIEDEPITAKTGVHELVNGLIPMRFEEIDKQLLDEFTSGIRGTNYALLLVPKSVSMNQFATIRQARSIGVQVIDKRAGAALISGVAFIPTSVTRENAAGIPKS